jgi:LPS sulfotransferase NodH
MSEAQSPPPGSRGYAVMTYARSGATWFAQLLGSTGVLGRPEDWFNGVGYRNRGVADYPLDRAGQLARVLSAGRSANGVYGVKLSPVRCDELRGFDWQGQLGPLAWIHLLREDRLGQAISDVRAQQTGQYRSTTPSGGPARFDAAMIANSLTRQLLDEARVRQFFAIGGIAPLELSYEQVLADEAGALARVAELVGVTEPLEPDRAAIALEVQRDAVSEEWRARFLALQRGGEMAPLALHTGLGGRIRAILGRIR